LGLKGFVIVVVVVVVYAVLLHIREKITRLQAVAI